MTWQILLCGGRKDGKKAKLFYRKMIKLAESEFQKYLEAIYSEKTNGKNIE